jgi:hypothetical protein
MIKGKSLNNFLASSSNQNQDQQSDIALAQLSQVRTIELIYVDAMIFSLMTISIKTLGIMTLSITKAQH